MTWQRTGSCPPERCQGRCCEHVGLWLPDDVEAAAFVAVLRVRGVRVQEFPGTLRYLVDFDQRCQYLTSEGLCALYGKPERPQFCADWPQEPGQLFNDPQCGFRFERAKEKVT